MPAFPKPAFTYNYQIAAQIAAIRDYEQTKPGRDVPDKAPDRLLVASWNVANLGLQERRDKDYRIIAEMISWFDLVAIQETNDDLTGLRAVQQHLPARFAAVFSDKGGNNERMAYLYDTAKVALLDKVGEVAVPRLPTDTSKSQAPLRSSPVLTVIPTWRLSVSALSRSYLSTFTCSSDQTQR